MMGSRSKIEARWPSMKPSWYSRLCLGSSCGFNALKVYLICSAIDSMRFVVKGSLPDTVFNVYTYIHRVESIQSLLSSGAYCVYTVMYSWQSLLYHRGFCMGSQWINTGSTVRPHCKLGRLNHLRCRFTLYCTFSHNLVRGLWGVVKMVSIPLPCSHFIALYIHNHSPYTHDPGARLRSLCSGA